MSRSPRRSAGEPLRASLLDRLLDDRPAARSEARDRVELTIDELRKTVLRDVGWLLNTSRLGDEDSFDGAEDAAHSVINYGVPDLVGLTSAGLDSARLEAEIRRSILDFEPRIVARTVRVRVEVPEAEMGRNAVSFMIEGQLWAEPAPVPISLRSEVDLETGTVSVRDDAGTKAE